MREIFEATIERIFTELVPASGVRGNHEEHWPTELWAAIEDVEMTFAAVPEELGGVGASWHDIYALVRAAGAHVVPAPFTDALLANWLLGRVGLSPAKGAIAAAADSTLSCSGNQASGILRDVPWGRHLARVVAIGTGDHPSVVVLDTTTASGIERHSNIAGEPRDSLSFDRAPVVCAAPLPEDLSPEILMLGGAMMRSAQIAGALQSLLRMTLTYASERVQFGKPIGQFQVIQHQLAQLAEHIVSSLIASEAAFAESTAAGFARLPVMAAKICASDAAGAGAAIAHAVHGAIGFTEEHRLHLHSRRLWAWRSEYGSQTYWAQRLGTQVCESGSAALWPTITRSFGATSASLAESLA